MDSYELTLDPSEVMFARSIAALRTGINRINNVVNPKFKESDDFQNDLLGCVVRWFLPSGSMFTWTLHLSPGPAAMILQ